MSEESDRTEFYRALLKLAGEVRKVNFNNPSGERAGIAKRKQKAQLSKGNADTMRRYTLAERVAKKTGVPVSHVSAAKLSEDHMKSIINEGHLGKLKRKPPSLVEMLGHRHSAKSLGVTAGIGAITGAAFARKYKLTKEQREKAGPLSRFAEKHPRLFTAAAGATAAASQAHARTLPGSIAAAIAPVVATHLADRGLKKLEDHKKAKQGAMNKLSGFSYDEKVAVARALLAEGVVTAQMALDLAKQAEVSPEQALELAKYAGFLPTLKKPTEEEKRKKQALVRAELGVYGVGGSAYLADKAQQGITGRTRMYHGTSKTVADKAMSKGLLPRSVTGAGGVTTATGTITDDASKSLVFAAPTRMEANEYATQAAYLDKHLRPEELHSGDRVLHTINEMRANPLHALSPLGVVPKGEARGKVLRLSMPMWRSDVASRVRENPEVHSLAAQINPIVKMTLQHEPGFEGGIGPEFIKGSPAYKKLNSQEIGQYIKTNPGKFSKGLGLAVGAAGTGVLSGKLLQSAWKKHKEKTAEVSPEQARRSLDRLDTLERNKPDLKQVRRYATVGGLGGMGVKAIGNTIENYHPTSLPGVKGKLVGLGAAAVKGKGTGEKIRSLASMGVTGALGAGVIPLARSGTDHRAEVKTLRRYMRENAGGTNA